MSKSFYVSNGLSGSVSTMLRSNGFSEVFKIEDADFLVLTGGADISPELYGEANVKSGPNTNRDQVEINDIQFALKKGIPSVGVCRGAQLLNVVSGGSMWQDVDNHRTSHEMISTYPIENQKLITTSVHHQMMIPLGNYRLIAYAKNRASIFTSDKGTFSSFEHKDPEVVYYPDTNALCIQGHPEFATESSPYQKYCIELVNLLLSGEMKSDLKDESE